MSKGAVQGNIMRKRQQRLIAFFDAVLAIAITMMALEVNVPVIENLGSVAIQQLFTELTAYLISFIVLGTLWFVHNNFFSYYQVTSSIDVVLHFMLMFVVTLFPSATEAMSVHQENMWIKIFYLTTFILLEFTLILILLNVKHRNNKLKENKIELLENILQVNLSSDDEKTKEIMEIIQKYKVYENVFEEMHEKIPEEYQLMAEKFKCERVANFRFSVYAIVIVTLSTFISVITLMYNLIMCYIALVLGIVMILVGKLYIEIRKGNS
ncbi:MAG: TMEM175 family protein [Oscillospiraceae bacterium]